MNTGPLQQLYQSLVQINVIMKQENTVKMSIFFPYFAVVSLFSAPPPCSIWLRIILMLGIMNTGPLQQVYQSLVLINVIIKRENTVKKSLFFHNCWGVSLSTVPPKCNIWIRIISTWEIMNTGPLLNVCQSLIQINVIIKKEINVKKSIFGHVYPVCQFSLCSGNLLWYIYQAVIFNEYVMVHSMGTYIAHKMWKYDHTSIQCCDSQVAVKPVLAGRWVIF